MRVCVHACVRACMRVCACVHAAVCVRACVRHATHKCPYNHWHSYLSGLVICQRAILSQKTFHLTQLFPQLSHFLLDLQQAGRRHVVSEGPVDLEAFKNIKNFARTIETKLCSQASRRRWLSLHRNVTVSCSLRVALLSALSLGAELQRSTGAGIRKASLKASSRNLANKKERRRRQTDSRTEKLCWWNWKLHVRASRAIGCRCHAAAVIMIMIMMPAWCCHGYSMRQCKALWGEQLASQLVARLIDRSFAFSLLSNSSFAKEGRRFLETKAEVSPALGWWDRFCSKAWFWRNYVPVLVLFSLTLCASCFTAQGSRLS